MVRPLARRAKASENSKDRPAISDEARENQMISYATNLAEQQLKEGTASSQVISHYLKLAATKEKRRLENDILSRQRELITAKTEALKAQKKNEEMYAEVLRALKAYNGQDDEDIQRVDTTTDL